MFYCTVWQETLLRATVEPAGMFGINFYINYLPGILKKGNSSTKSLAYTSLVHPILECGVACWDPYRKGHINALDQVQNTATKFARHRNDSNWETLTVQKGISHMCSVQSVRRRTGLKGYR
jgi:hypothetical protein